MTLQIDTVSKRFGRYQALDTVSLDIPKGELVALLGPSGSGKTTLLRIIAGLETPDQGRVLFDGEDATDVAPRYRQIGFVFQHYALFPHLSVFENVAFGLRVMARDARPTEEQIQMRVSEILKLVRLTNLGERFPAQLSGGQRQRVALARALVIRPRVLLLDEPFGALDVTVRTELRRWLRELQQELGLTTIFVTHDQEEASAICDRIAILNDGRLLQAGSPVDLYRAPASSFVAGFLGSANILARESLGAGAALGHLSGPKVAFRPADGTLAVASATTAPAGHLRLPGTVQHREFLGSIVRYAVARTGGEMQIDAPFKVGEAFIAPGTEVVVDVPYDALIGLES
ncbi:sulfate ABC transporter ATP-binding protein [Nordella sp. HKS 07]|uniref:sulfate/molybdate ABC transporter ATP-binding protein n=1 Tax=Nordella sp. HKS 07 TaxID=2712222 RepID=UPI0013E126D9|nr:sulfate ABC transporter ATP-binding protein [Nordella sp. HKS 07]QIG46714.1 sulfate ABC transporter ATP-binding protein [Nordella sp. HKS 07]